MSVTLETTALDTAASERETAAGQQAVDVAGPFAGVPDALTGSATAEAAAWVSTRVAASVQVQGDDIRGMSASASGTAQGYRDAEVAQALGSALLRSDVVVRHAEDREPPLLGLFTGPGGAWVVEARQGSGERPVARPATRAGAEAQVADAVRTALSAVGGA